MSGNYVITGKLGAGKNLCAVSKMQQYLKEGRTVATNIDIKVEKLLGSKKLKNTRVIRLPDHPKLEDLEAIGRAYKGSYDEEKSGGIFLDECGTWLNARDWQDKSKRPLLDYLLHIRKRGWDMFFLIQDVAVLDKQFRKSLAEHVVYCRRMDRMTVPIIGVLLKMLGIKQVFPKLHVGVVKYGDNPQSLTIDQWWYRGVDLYDAYDTTQIFSPSYSDGTYTLLPPAYLFRDIAKKNVRFYMRLSKIYLRKYSRATAFMAGMVTLLMFNVYLQKDSDLKAQEIVEEQPVIEEKETSLVQSIVQQEEPIKPLQQVDVIEPVEEGPCTIPSLDRLFITGDMRSKKSFSYMLNNNQILKSNHQFQVKYYDSCLAEVTDTSTKCTIQLSCSSPLTSYQYATN